MDNYELARMKAKKQVDTTKNDLLKELQSRKPDSITQLILLSVLTPEQQREVLTQLITNQIIEHERVERFKESTRGRVI